MSPRIFVLDDEPDLLLALSVRLGAAGFSCETARDSAEGLEQIRRRSPDLIITDLVMPGIDGYELLRRLRADPHTAGIPVIAITALPKPVLDQHAEELHGLSVIRKPFEFGELLLTMRKLLDSTRGG